MRKYRETSVYGKWKRVFSMPWNKVKPAHTGFNEKLIVSPQKTVLECKLWLRNKSGVGGKLGAYEYIQWNFTPMQLSAERFG